MEAMWLLPSYSDPNPDAASRAPGLPANLIRQQLVSALPPKCTLRPVPSRPTTATQQGGRGHPLLCLPRSSRAGSTPKTILWNQVIKFMAEGTKEGRVKQRGRANVGEGRKVSEFTSALGPQGGGTGLKETSTQEGMHAPAPWQPDRCRGACRQGI